MFLVQQRVFQVDQGQILATVIIALIYITGYSWLLIYSVSVLYLHHLQVDVPIVLTGV